MNTQTRRLFIAVATLGVALGVSSVARAGGAPSAEGNAASEDSYTFTTVDVVDSLGTSVNANSTHAVAGDFDDADGNTHGFVLRKGVFTQIDVPYPDAISTSINGINAKGVLAGTYFDDNWRRIHAFTSSNGVFTVLDPPGSTESQGGFINGRGEVVGGYRDVNNVRHAFLWRKGVFATIDPPDGHPTLGPVAFGINNHGNVVGTYVDPDENRHGFLLSKGTFTDVDVPDAAYTVAEGISDDGTIVGLYMAGDGSFHGFVYSDGLYNAIDVPGSTRTYVLSINAAGEIAGNYDDADGLTHGFVAKPMR